MGRLRLRSCSTIIIIIIAFSIFQLVWYFVTLNPKTVGHEHENHPNDNHSSAVKEMHKKQSDQRRKAVTSGFNEHDYVMGEPKSSDSYKRNSFNLTASDMLPSNRQIKDSRNKLCRFLVFSKSLPSTSVIICFHNEARSTLLRTVVSVLNRSPPNLIHEIILVDDFSDDANDGLLLESIPKVKVLRNNEREGLVRSRIKGADYATAPVLTFLDSHCECNVGWLEPLLQRVMQDPRIVVCPVIDIIDFNKFTYAGVSAMQRGGFDWTMIFKWGGVPKSERKSGIDPIKAPVIAGGLFAINRQRFIETGKYDPEMDIWGGENLEISFRTWMCGGSMEIIPCSRVGHVFRMKHPYSFPDGISDTCIKNMKRTAEVWMDEYKEIFYAAQPKARHHDIGSIDERLALRKKLDCNSFDWYMKNIYPDMAIPNHENALLGSIRQQAFCLSSVLDPHVGRTLGLYPCNERTGNQVWVLTTDHTIVTVQNLLCLQSKGTEVVLRQCLAGSQSQQWKWSKDAKTVKSISSGYCLSSAHGRTNLVLEECNESLPAHQWTSIYHKLVN